MKLWDKGINVDSKIEKFTIGNYNELDIHLAPFDVLGNIAHVTMLGEVGLMSKEEAEIAVNGLKEIAATIELGSFIIEELTDLVEEAVYAEFDIITERGGVLGAMETMYQLLGMPF